MEYYQIFGLVFAALIAIVGFFISIKKSLNDEKKPIEDLNLNIVRLNTNFEHMLENDVIRDRRITRHGEEIDEIIEKQRENEKTLIKHDMRIGNLEKIGHIDSKKVDS